MSAAEHDVRTAELKQKLVELEALFRTEAYKRGFDPAQVENMALPAALARLFAQCAEIKSELSELADQGEGMK